MLNPFGSNNDSGSYVNLQKRIFQRVKTSGIKEQFIASIQRAFENAINTENIVLSRPERNRLYSQILKLMLEDLNNSTDDRS